MCTLLLSPEGLEKNRKVDGLVSHNCNVTPIASLWLSNTHGAQWAA